MGLINNADLFKVLYTVLCSGISKTYSAPSYLNLSGAFFYRIHRCYVQNQPMTTGDYGHDCEARILESKL